MNTTPISYPSWFWALLGFLTDSVPASILATGDVCSTLYGSASSVYTWCSSSDRKEIVTLKIKL